MGAFLDVAVLVKRERWMSGIVGSDVSDVGYGRPAARLSIDNRTPRAETCVVDDVRRDRKGSAMTCSRRY